MRLHSVAVLTLTASLLALGACSSVRTGVGLNRITPDEFLTVSTAPLTVPPEYGLRPPAPGQPRPQELAPESAARQILLGQRQAVTRSEGEQQLVTLALESRDAIAPQLHGLIRRTGALVGLVLTQVIGRAIGLVGRGILQGMGRSLGRS